MTTPSMGALDANPKTTVTVEAVLIKADGTKVDLGVLRKSTRFERTKRRVQKWLRPQE